MMNGIQAAARSDSPVYCGSFSGGPSVVPNMAGSSSSSEFRTSNSRQFGPYCSEEQRKMYDAYLTKLDPKSDFSKMMIRQSQARNVAPEVAKKSTPKPPASEEERLRIRARYAEKAKERQIRMYEQALVMAEEREREEGRKYRAQRTIKFHVNYQTYFGQNVYVCGSSKSLGGWNAAKALPLTWSPGNVWSGAATLSTDDGLVEYKYVLIDSNTGGSQWESGFNHKINTTEINSSAILIEDRWGSGSL